MAAFIPKRKFPISQMVAERLTGARVSQRYSQKGLADLVGCSPAKIGRYESGVCPLTVDTFVTVCEALGQSPAEVLSANYIVRL